VAWLERGATPIVTIPLAPRTARAIDLAIGERTEGPLFITGDGRRLDRHGADRIVRRVTRRAGIAKQVGPHTLRHAFITAALDAGVPLRDVQEAASHADPRTTMRYDPHQPRPTRYLHRVHLHRRSSQVAAIYIPEDGLAALGGQTARYFRNLLEMPTECERWQRSRTAVRRGSRRLRRGCRARTERVVLRRLGLWLLRRRRRRRHAPGRAAQLPRELWSSPAVHGRLPV
jgi:Phage integrase family